MVQDAYLDLYRSERETIMTHSAGCLNALRDEAVEALGRNGLPIYPEEYAKDFGLNLLRYRSQGNPYKLFACDVPNIGAYTVYVMNDCLYENPSAPALPEGVIICPLAQAAVEHADIVSKYYGKQVDASDGNAALNLAFAQDGLFVYVPKGLRLERPIQLINLMYASADLMAVSHNLIVIEEDAAAQLMVCDHTHGDKAVSYMANRITEVFVGRNAVYDHVKVENSHNNMCNICTLLLSLSSGSEVVSDIITLCNHKTRNTVVANINGDHASLSLNGLAICDGKQVCDNTTFINHLEPASVSNELFKYILDEEATGNFYGLVKVVPGAQKTSALQTNKNLCLSPGAVMHTKPQLEIYADDVKCNHGATIGQLDETALFYMRSRGISFNEARMLLMFAFVKDVLSNIRIPALRERLEMLIEKRLRKEESKCANCYSRA